MSDPLPPQEPPSGSTPDSARSSSISIADLFGGKQIGGVDLRVILLILSITGGGTLANMGIGSLLGFASTKDLAALETRHQDLTKTTETLETRHADLEKRFLEEIREHDRTQGEINRRIDRIELQASFTAQLLKTIYPKEAARLPDPISIP